MDRLIGQHMLRLDPKEARDMIDLFLIENKQRNYTFEVSCVFNALYFPMHCNRNYNLIHPDSCLGQVTAKKLCILRAKLPPVHLTTNGRSFILVLLIAHCHTQSNKLF